MAHGLRRRVWMASRKRVDPPAADDDMRPTPQTAILIVLLRQSHALIPVRRSGDPRLHGWTHTSAIGLTARGSEFETTRSQRDQCRRRHQYRPSRSFLLVLARQDHLQKCRGRNRMNHLSECFRSHRNQTARSASKGRGARTHGSGRQSNRKFALEFGQCLSFPTKRSSHQCRREPNH